MCINASEDNTLDIINAQNILTNQINQLQQEIENAQYNISRRIHYNKILMLQHQARKNRRMKKEIKEDVLIILGLLTTTIILNIYMANIK